MLKSYSLSLAASLALVGSLTLVGCGSSTSTDTVRTGSSSDTLPTVQTIQTGSISGTVYFINEPTDRTIRTTDATAQIVAYNLDDNTEYTTTSTPQGEFDLSGLTEGRYQLIATSTSTTMRSIRQVTVERNTRKVVDIVLQATGIIKGTIPNYNNYVGSIDIVFIPGTSYISTVDKDGNFELINVPAGEVTISFDNYYMQNVTVVGGEETIVENFGEMDSINNDIYYVSSLATDSTLVMQHDGISVYTKELYTLAEFEKLVSLENNMSQAVDIQVSYENETWEETQLSDRFKIRTSTVVDAGTYTLKINTPGAYTKEITLIDKVAVFNGSGVMNGIYQKSINIAFSNPVEDINTSAVTVSYLDDTNTTKVLPLTGIMPIKEKENVFKLLGDFQVGVKYKVTLDPAIQEDGLFYVAYDNYSLDGITIGDARVGYISVDDNEENVPLTKEIRFTIYDAYPLDLQTLKVTLADQNLTLKNGGLRSASIYSFYNDYLEVLVDNSVLKYSQDYNMTITAHDTYGDKVIDKTISFSTITPQIVGVLPYYYYTDTYFDYLRSSMYASDGILKAYFNVDVDYDSGSITLYDNTNNKNVEVYTTSESTAYQPYTNDISTAYSVGVTPAELLPNTEYTMTVAGFTTPDGTKIATRTNTFKTPSRALLSSSVSNGQLLNASDLQNRLEFTFFGKLSDAEKADFTNGLDITSFNTALPADKTHPEPLVLWDESYPYGSKLILAFTIDSGTSYELRFSGTVAQELDMTASPLTFMTMSDEDGTAMGFSPKYKIINSFYTFSGSEDYNLSVVNSKVDGYAEVTIPYIVDENYNGDSNEKCIELMYKNIYNYPGYDTAPDVNSSVIATWLSGDVLSVTSTKLNSIYYNYHYNYDENGNFPVEYYSCDISYSAYFTMSGDVNSSVTLSVPFDGELVADNFVATDTNRTLMAPGAEEAYASVQVYSNGFTIYFSKPVLVQDAENINFQTNPNLNVKVNTPYAPYFDADGNYYTMELSGSFDTGVYSVFAYDLNDTLTYFDRVTQTQKDLNVTHSGIVYTNADLVPLEVSNVSTQSNSIYLDVNREVDIATVLTRDENGTVVSSAFILTNENNESNVTASITNAYNSFNFSTNSGSLVLDVTRSDAQSGCYDAENFTLTQVKSIKAKNSIQTLDAGSIKANIVLPAETIGCVVDANTTP